MPLTLSALFDESRDKHGDTTLRHTAHTPRTVCGTTATRQAIQILSLVVRTAVVSLSALDHLHYSTYFCENEKVHTQCTPSPCTHSINTHRDTHTPELNHTLKRAGVHRVRPIPCGFIGGVIDVVVTATTRVVGLGPPAGQRRLAWLGVGLKFGLGWG